MKTKKDCLGNKVVLSKNKLYYYEKASECLFKIVTMLNDRSALKEFNRVTCSYRGCGNHSKMKHPQAKIYYSQLIIQC